MPITQQPSLTSSGTLETLCWEVPTNEVLVGLQERRAVLYSTGYDPNSQGGSKQHDICTADLLL